MYCILNWWKNKHDVCVSYVAMKWEFVLKNIERFLGESLGGLWGEYFCNTFVSKISVKRSFDSNIRISKLSYTKWRSLDYFLNANQ